LGLAVDIAGPNGQFVSADSQLWRSSLGFVGAIKVRQFEQVVPLNGRQGSERLLVRVTAGSHRFERDSASFSSEVDHNPSFVDRIR
jgi:hypothetical protein